MLNNTELEKRNENFLDHTKEVKVDGHTQTQTYGGSSNDYSEALLSHLDNQIINGQVAAPPRQFEAKRQTMNLTKARRDNAVV